jgi:FAD/FMN-containing dehydrogenase
MAALRIRSFDQAERGIDPQVVQSLAGRMSGSLVDASKPGYDEARTIWNAMIDRRPALIARCANAADVTHVVRFAAENSLLTSIRGGGHNIAGLAICDGGLCLDLSGMKKVAVDPATRRVRVEPGATLADLDAATQAHGLAVPVGVNSTTGVAGLTLGGGFGWTSRKLGLTIDNLRSADVVLADGRRVRASEDEERDLFWALRGGGGNFGVVTEFEFEAQPLGPTVLAGLVVHPVDAGRQVLRHLRDCNAAAPDALTTWAVLRKAPPLPFLPAEWHGREVVVLAMCYAGDVAEGERATAALRRFGSPIADVVGPAPLTGWQQAFDPLLTPGARNYWKSHDFAALSDPLIDVLLSHVTELPSDETEIFLAHQGAAVRRVSDDSTAYGARDAEFIVNVHARWRATEDDARVIGWARKFYDAMAPMATGSVYVNFMPGDEPGRLTNAYGGNLARLQAVKARYDPANLFRVNQNIAPAAAPA